MQPPVHNPQPPQGGPQYGPPQTGGPQYGQPQYAPPGYGPPGYGPQGGGPVLAGLRAIVHALRGWPTPCGAFVQSGPGLFDADGNCLDDKVREQLELVGRQVVAFARNPALAA